MAVSSLAGSISSNFAFVGKVPMLMKATSNDEKATQGYVLREISDISKASLPHCQSLLNFLFARLEKNSPLIKYKVLHIMKYLVVNGHSEFRSKLRRNPEVVKQTVSFKGELDPIHGDGLNINVRNAASELELLLFDVDNPKVEIICKSLIAPSQSGEKMQGFGYNGAPPIKQASFMDVSKKLKESVSGLYSWKEKGNLEPASFAQSVYPQQPSYTPLDLPSDQEDFEQKNDSCGTSSDKNCSETFEKRAENDVCYYYESKLVNDITAKGGVRSTPSMETLKAFVDKSSSLDLQVILQLLDEKLRNPLSNVQLKSLCILEYLLRCNLENISNSINDCCGTIQALITCDDTTVQAKAKKIALTIASCLKQEELDKQASSPPSYNLAKELPKVESKKHEEYKKKETEKDQRNAGMESLFSGMKFSKPTSIDPPVHTTAETHPVSGAHPVSKTHPVSSAHLVFDAHPVSDAYPVFDAHPVSDGPDQEADLLGLETENTEQGTGTISSAFSANGESRNSVDLFDPLIQLESKQPGGTSTPGDSTVDFLLKPNCESNMTQNNENATTVAVNGGLLQSRQHTLMPIAPSPLFHGGLGLRTNVTSSSCSERRPLPKDMKQEVDGFGFLWKSSKKDAFSFVSDEMEARKTNSK